MNNISQFPHRMKTTLLADRFVNQRPFLETNPLRKIQFNGSIHKTVSEHFIENRISVFSNVNLEIGDARRFYFQFFVGLLSAARLKPGGDEITSAYINENDDRLHILVLMGKKEAVLHHHKICIRKLIGKSAKNSRSTNDTELEALRKHVQDVERQIDSTISIGVVENHEYELLIIPSTGTDHVEMILLRSTRYERNNMVPSEDQRNFINPGQYKKQPKSQLLQGSFMNVWKSTEQPTADDLIILMRNAMKLTNDEPFPSHEPSTEAMRVTGFLYGALLSALPDAYYSKIMSSQVPTIHYNDYINLLYFPPVSTSPHQHYLIDMDSHPINSHIGYELFDYLAHNNSEMILEVRCIGTRSSPSYSTRNLQWSVENIFENLNADILEASDADVEILEENFAYYSNLMSGVLSYETISYEMKSVDDLRSFLIGSFRVKQDASIEVSHKEAAFGALYVKKTKCFILTFHAQTDFSIHQLIQSRKSDSIFSFNLQYGPGHTIKLKPASTIDTRDVKQIYDFQELSKLNLATALRITNATSREFFHAEMKAFFTSVKEQGLTNSSTGACVAGVFHNMQVDVEKFDESFTKGRCNIRAELLLDEYKVPLYMELFESSSILAAQRALRLRRMVGGRAIIMTFNLSNDEDELAIMAELDGRRYLNTDNVDAVCRDAVRKDGPSVCGDEAKHRSNTSYTEIESKTIKKFPKVKAHLSKLYKLAGRLRLGLIGRDMMRGFYGKDLKAAMNGEFFFRPPVAGSKIEASVAALAGKTLVRESSPSLGMCWSALAYDTYMGLQLYHELNSNDTESAEFTGTFIGIDLMKCAFEAMAEFKLIPFGAAATGLLTVLAVGVAVAENVMRAAHKTSEITQILPLTTDEKVYEFSRVFFFFGTDDIIQAMKDEVTANEVTVLQTLKQNPNFGRFVVSAAAKANEDRSLIFIDDNIIDLTRRHFFNKSRLMPRKNSLAENITAFCALDEALNPNRQKLQENVAIGNTLLRYFGQSSSMSGELRLPKTKPYTDPIDDYYCENAFGITNETKSDHTKTLFLLFNGTDNVKAFPKSQNVFLLMNGNKSINGGLEQDYFYIRADYIYGYLNGSGSEDVVDFSASDAGKDLVIKNGEAFLSPMHDNTHTLKLYEIESIIGRSSLSDYVELCNETKIDLAGATYGMDRIILTNSCRRTTRRNVTITLRKNTFIKCETHDLVHYIVTDNSEADLLLEAGHHNFHIDLVNFSDVAINGSRDLWMVNISDVSLLRIRTNNLSGIVSYSLKEI